MPHTGHVDAHGLADTCRRVAGRLDELCLRHPRAEQLHRARRWFAGPPRIAVFGRAGSGRRTLRTAIEDRLGCTAIDVPDGDADVSAYLLASQPRERDLDALEQLPAHRTLVVLGKADAVDPAEFERPGIPVRVTAPSLAVVRPTDHDITVLRALADCGVRRPMTAAAVLEGVRDEIAGPATELARRYGRGAMLIGLDAVARSRDIDAEGLDALLFERSGVADLLQPIRELAAHAAPQRLSNLSAELNRLAAAGVARDDLECLLAGDLQAVIRG